MVMVQHRLFGHDPLQLRARQPTGLRSRSNAGAKKAFVGIDIADAVQQALVQQSRLDAGAARMEQRIKLAAPDCERLAAGSGKSLRLARVAQVAYLKIARLRITYFQITYFRITYFQITDFEPSKSPRIDEANLAAILQGEPRVSMLDDRGLGLGDQQPPGHAQMHDPLRICRARVCSRPGRSQIADDVLADAMDAEESGTREQALLRRRRRLHRFGMASEPRGDDARRTHAIMDAARNGFHFRQLGHESDSRPFRAAARRSGGPPDHSRAFSRAFAGQYMMSMAQAEISCARRREAIYREVGNDASEDSRNFRRPVGR